MKSSGYTITLFFGGGLFLLFLLLTSRHIMRYVTPLNCVQPNPLIPSEQQLNVNSLNLTSTSKNYLVSFYCCLMALLLFATSIAKKHPPFTSLLAFVFL